MATQPQSVANPYDTQTFTMPQYTEISTKSPQQVPYFPPPPTTAAQGPVTAISSDPSYQPHRTHKHNHHHHQGPYDQPYQRSNSNTGYTADYDSDSENEYDHQSARRGSDRSSQPSRSSSMWSRAWSTRQRSDGYEALPSKPGALVRVPSQDFDERGRRTARRGSGASLSDYYGSEAEVEADGDYLYARRHDHRSPHRSPHRHHHRSVSRGRRSSADYHVDDSSHEGGAKRGFSLRRSLSNARDRVREAFEDSDDEKTGNTPLKKWAATAAGALAGGIAADQAQKRIAGGKYRDPETGWVKTALGAFIGGLASRELEKMWHIKKSTKREEKEDIRHETEDEIRRDVQHETVKKITNGGNGYAYGQGQIVVANSR